MEKRAQSPLDYISKHEWFVTNYKSLEQTSRHVQSVHWAQSLSSILQAASCRPAKLHDSFWFLTFMGSLSFRSLANSYQELSLQVDPCSVPDKCLTLGSILLSWLQKVLLIRGQVHWPSQTTCVPVIWVSPCCLCSLKVYIFRIPLWKERHKRYLGGETRPISYSSPNNSSSPSSQGPGTDKNKQIRTG